MTVHIRIYLDRTWTAEYESVYKKIHQLYIHIISLFCMFFDLFKFHLAIKIVCFLTIGYRRWTLDNNAAELHCPCVEFIKKYYFEFL